MNDVLGPFDLITWKTMKTIHLLKKSIEDYKKRNPIKFKNAIAKETKLLQFHENKLAS